MAAVTTGNYSTGVSTSDSNSSSDSELKSYKTTERQVELIETKPRVNSKSKTRKPDPRAIAAHKLDTLQIQISLVLDFLLLGLSKLNPSKYSKFYMLQYQYPGTDRYDLGLDDTYFVVFVIVNLTLIRSLTMVYVLTPLAKMVHMHKFKAMQRFREQGWVGHTIK
ncbi:unnamed protein product [Ambrosiozyma monospora]|uniref:Unnamed protein product n=1 Tax=Ambrosiozyma monospora TaxID=43982 RepID=A0A9W6YUL1_AMBMO|nr:unnamed protein product [Ambrosiozyma monospora]